MAVAENNLERKNKGWRPLHNLKGYRRQLLATVDSTGQKQVQIKCFSDWAVAESSWKKRVFRVSDGGISYFQLRIDLNKMNYYNFWVNGLA
jgi:hypothetical protein